MEILSLPYGTHPYQLRLHRAASLVVPPATPAPAHSVEVLLERALDAPIDAPPLDQIACRRAVIAISDTSRSEPRDALVRAVLRRLGREVSVTVAVATGTHGPCDLERLGLGDDLRRRVTMVNHDGHRDDDLVAIGTTPRGTPIRVHRCVVEADLVVATGVIRPHYFAGFGAGIKSVFPGLGGNREIRINHAAKTHPAARAGLLDGNPCRDDLEDVASLVPARLQLLNLVVDAHGRYQAAFAGHIRHAHRAGAALCDRMVRVRAPRSRLVIVSDGGPVVASLYQASKLVAAAAPLLAPGGTIALAAECRDGIGPVDVVNRAIYEIGLRPRLPDPHQVVLVSCLGPDVVAPTYCTWAASLEPLLDLTDDTPVVIPSAASLILEPELP